MWSDYSTARRAVGPYPAGANRATASVLAVWEAEGEPLPKSVTHYLSDPDTGNRYPAYSDVVAETDYVVYITSNLPVFDTALSMRLAKYDQTSQVRTLGLYTAYCDLPRHAASVALHTSTQVGN